MGRGIAGPSTGVGETGSDQGLHAVVGGAPRWEEGPMAEAWLSTSDEAHISPPCVAYFMALSVAAINISPRRTPLRFSRIRPSRPTKKALGMLLTDKSRCWWIHSWMNSRLLFHGLFHSHFEHFATKGSAPVFEDPTIPPHQKCAGNAAHGQAGRQSVVAPTLHQRMVPRHGVFFLEGRNDLMLAIEGKA